VNPDEPTPRRRLTDHIESPVEPAPPIPEITETSASIGQEIQKTLKILGACTIVLYIVMILLAGWTFRQAHRNKDALCALRGDAQSRIETSQQFLIQNHNGIPGVSAEQLKNSIANSVRTVQALSNLKCDGG
jgi:hypothetical protein